MKRTLDTISHRENANPNHSDPPLRTRPGSGDREKTKRKILSVVEDGPKLEPPNVVAGGNVDDSLETPQKVADRVTT